MERMLTMDKNKVYQLGLYEKAMPSHLSWKEKLEATKVAGFDWLEISVDETEDKLHRLEMDPKFIDEIKTALKETRVPILTMCLSGHRKYPLGAHDEEIRDQSLVIMRKAIDLAQELGIRIIQLAGYDVYYETSDEITQNYFRENLKKAVLMAAQKGICLGFETMETPFMDTVTKAMRYVSDIQSPYLGVYPDIGNLTNASRMTGISVQADLKQGQGHIYAAHLKEIVEGKYREIPFGTGDTHYEAAINALMHQGVRLFTAEFWYVGNATWKEDLAFASTYLRAKIESHELRRKDVK